MTRRVSKEGGKGNDDMGGVGGGVSMNTYVNLAAACFVTAATTPPPSFPFFLSFFAPFILRNQLRS